MKVADKRAKKLAKKVLGKDFNLLMKRGYLVRTIKIKNGKKIVRMRMLISKDIYVYGYNKKRYHRYCSELLEESINNPYRPYEYRGYYAESFSKFDRLIAFYIWLKHYSKHPISRRAFNRRFNFIGSVMGNTLQDIVYGDGI